MKLIEPELRKNDAQWFTALRSFSLPTAVRSYAIKPVNMRSCFNTFVASGKKINPQFEYLFLDENANAVAKGKLLSLRSKILQEEAQKSISTLYLQKVDELLLSLDMLSATATADYSQFSMYTEKLYGSLDKTIFDAVLSDMAGHSPYIKDLQIRVQRHPSSHSDVFVVPTADTISSAEKYLEPLQFLTEQSHDTYTADQVVEIWNENLQKVAPKWRCKVSTRTNTINVRNKSQVILIPKKARYSADKIHQLYAHEVGVHVRRYENGFKSPLQLLAIGLAGYQAAEEGLAIMSSQLVAGEFRFSGRDKYFALGVATGLFDGKSRDFQETFAFLEPYYIDRFSRHNRDDVDIVATEYVWRLCVRIFRGGNPALPGLCFLKDKLYLEGNLRMWAAMAERPELFESVLLGKYDPTNQLQQELLRELIV